MTTRPYTLRSFIELAENESTHGRDLSRTNSRVRKATTSLQKRRQAYRTAIISLTQADPNREVLRAAYKEEREKLRRERDAAIESVLYEALTEFEARLDDGTFGFALRVGPIVGGKQTYQISPGLSTTYPAKQAAAAIRTATAVDPPNRNSIVRALKEALDKEYAHAVYRTDIQNFFESIPHRVLMDKISSLPGLDGVSAELARTLLYEFATITGADTGLPRGAGLSSQLADLFMTDFDLYIKAQPGVLFYARYVDDIVIVIENHKLLSTVRQLVVDQLATVGLQVKDEKTSEIKISEQGAYPNSAAVEYLGYRFVRHEDGLTTALTAARSHRRRNRLRVACEHWLASDPHASAPNHGHDGLLVDRVRYLAGNTRLSNSKSSVSIGLYHSNSSLDSGAGDLVELDRILGEFIESSHHRMDPRVVKRLREVSFVSMFASRPFLRIPQKRIEQIVSVWKVVGA